MSLRSLIDKAARQAKNMLPGADSVKPSAAPEKVPSGNAPTSLPHASTPAPGEAPRSEQLKRAI